MHAHAEPWAWHPTRQLMPLEALGRNTRGWVGSRSFNRKMTHEIRDPTPDRRSGRDAKERASIERAPSPPAPLPRRGEGRRVGPGQIGTGLIGVGRDTFATRDRGESRGCLAPVGAEGRVRGGSGAWTCAPIQVYLSGPVGAGEERDGTRAARLGPDTFGDRGAVTGEKVGAGDQKRIPAGDGNPFSLREKRIPGSSASRIRTVEIRCGHSF